jgi:hypothetical protein
MSAQDLLLKNNYISLHNLSITEGVTCYRLAGSQNTEPSDEAWDRGDYFIVHDTRTHSLSVFTNSSGGEIIHGEDREAARKTLHNIRDKWNESSRVFVPRMYRTPESWASLSARTETEYRLNVVNIKNNKPLFSAFPLWCFKGNPVLALLLRVPKIHNWFVSRPDFVKMLLDGTIDTEPRDWIRYIEDIEGQGPLESIGFRQCVTTTVDKLLPKVSSLIPFEPFVMKSHKLMTVITTDAFKRLDQFQITPDYIILEHTTNELLPPTYAGYRMSAWVSSHGMITQRTSHPSGYHVCLSAHSEHQEIHLSWDSLEPSKYSTHILWQRDSIGRCDHPEETDPIPRRIEGSYVPPVDIQARSAVIPFRPPMGCTSMKIERFNKFPCAVQEKLDGNRIIVHVLGCDTEVPLVKYYSRVGILQTSKFNEQFDMDVIAFCSSFNRCSEGVTQYKNVMIDCECYADDVIHAEIGGWCNRVDISPGFRKLKLHILSYLDLDTITTGKLRGRDYSMSSKTLCDILVELGRYGNPGPTLAINKTYRAESREDLDALMREIVSHGGEGLVLYPLDQPYTFENAGLMKVKTIFDGECVILGYRASTTDPDEIGSVLVRSHAYFDKSRNWVEFYVNAALRDDVKGGSMTSVHFAGCITKLYTIVCGSFSENGTPIHARFKAPFSPDTERLDSACNLR